MKPYLAILALAVASTLTAKQSAPNISGSCQQREFLR